MIQKNHYLRKKSVANKGKDLTDLFYNLTDYVVENLDNMSLQNVVEISGGYSLRFKIKSEGTVLDTTVTLT